VTSSPRHFVDLADFGGAELKAILDKAGALKRVRRTPEAGKPLAGKVLAMIFERPSTRTRVSFDVGMRELGGETIMLTGTEMQLGRGETISDTAKVLSRYVDAIMIRMLDHNAVRELANAASVPVINGLTKLSHPCQIMADVMTYEEHRGSIGGRTVAWSGDASNVARSWVHAAVKFGFRLRLACPPALRLNGPLLEWVAAERGDVAYTDRAEEAVEEADLVVTDTWVSMGAEAAEKRHNLLAPFRVTEPLMRRAKPDALFMHCLPAHRGQEVTDAVIDGPQSVVWDEAENRLHAQKGILAWCMG